MYVSGRKKQFVLRIAIHNATTHEESRGHRSAAFRLQKRVTLQGIEPIPTPFQLSSSCSLKAALLCPVVLSRCAHSVFISGLKF